MAKAGRGLGRPSALALRRGMTRVTVAAASWGMPRFDNCIVRQPETRKNERELWLNGQLLGNRTEGKPGAPRTLPPAPRPELTAFEMRHKTTL